jgi:hypothetical protein
MCLWAEHKILERFERQSRDRGRPRADGAMRQRREEVLETETPPDASCSHDYRVAVVGCTCRPGTDS